MLTHYCHIYFKWQNRHTYTFVINVIFFSFVVLLPVSKVGSYDKYNVITKDPDLYYNITYSNIIHLQANFVPDKSLTR